ncbi:FAD-dependent monooxygenase [Saccharomonospora piscinae]|uniref:FAD-dependent monooxygenase n=1 Tax=Saccharomonospora piscinae TaxID=687388 RepID=UPI000464829E|nr:FAD-dependent monooxygenase [Saccharomonospora piscinae]
MAEHTEVLVVGGGPTGLTVACGLAAHGVGVRVVDRASGPATTSRANIAHARAVEVLHRLGALGDLRERSLEPRAMRMHAGSRPIATVGFAPDEAESTQALFVSQAMIERRLRDRFAELGGTVEWATSLTGFEQNADGVTAEFGHGTRLRAQWLVGCDGAHSTVRELAGIDFPGVPVAERFLLADVHADWHRDRSMSVGYFHRDGIVMAMPMYDHEHDTDGGDRWRLMAEVADLDGRLDADEIVARFAELVPARTGETELRIRDAVWTSVFRIHRRLAADYRRGHVLLAGDAAHVHSPIGGQGMNTGLGDAENLAWKLALVVRGSAAEPLLDTYTAERRPLAAEVLRATTANTRLLTADSAVVSFLRDRVLVPLLDTARVRRAATRGASQLWVTYRKGPLGGRGSAPRPGDRIADRACLDSEGRSTRLHAELLPAWVVLAPPGGHPDALARTARDQLGGEVTALTDPGAQGQALLIRPDAHLAWRGTDPDGLRRWLTTALSAGTTA